MLEHLNLVEARTVPTMKANEYTNSNFGNRIINMPRCSSTMIAAFVIVTITTINLLFCMEILSSWSLSVRLQQVPILLIHPNNNQVRYNHHYPQKHLKFEKVDLHEKPVSTGIDTRSDNGNNESTPRHSDPIGPETTSKPPTQQLRLRLDWTKLQRYSPLAKQVSIMQQNCSNTKGYFWSRNKSGLGSDLHYYSIALCNALEYSRAANQMMKDGGDGRGMRVMTLRPWIWYSTNDCSDGNQSSAMKCYFPESEPDCEMDTVTKETTLPTLQSRGINMTRRQGGITEDCPNVIASVDDNVSNVRAAITEFLFTRVSDLVQQEGNRQLNLVFGRPDLNENIRNTKSPSLTTAVPVVVPKNLITVHIRWGDKGREMNLFQIAKYIAAIEQIVQERRRTNRNSRTPIYKDSLVTVAADNDDDDSSDAVNIFLATEDPEAVTEFQKAAPKVWNIYVDQYYIENLVNRQTIGNIYNVNTIAALQSDGKTGLLALGSLLVAMEANDYVLTTGSNWSRLMNEIRISILNPRCNNCTTMIDLKRGGQ